MFRYEKARKFGRLTTVIRPASFGLAAMRPKTTAKGNTSERLEDNDDDDDNNDDQQSSYTRARKHSHTHTHVGSMATTHKLITPFMEARFLLCFQRVRG